MASKETRPIYQLGDTIKRKVDCYAEVDEADDSAMVFGRISVDPMTAYAKLWSDDSQDWIQLGATTDEDDCTIVDNSIEYLVTADKFPTAGQYQLIIGAVFPDGQVKQQVWRFKVKGFDG